MLSAIRKKTVPPPPSRVAEIVSHLEGKLQGSPLLDVLTAVDAAKGPLADQLEGLLKSRVGAKALALKALNLLVAKYHFQARSETLFSRPFGLLVDPANGCNLACPGCVHSEHSKSLKLFDWDKGMLSEERFQALLRQYGTYAVQIMFCNYGEPTANLKTPRFIELAKSYLIQTAISTNLTVGRFDAEAYVASGLDFMYLSIDGATQPVYEQFRKNGNIDLIYENIRKLVAAKKRLGTRTPILRWQFLAFEHNEHEIPLALERAKEVGVDHFVVETPFDVSWDTPGVRVSKVPAAIYELTPHTESALESNFASKLAEIHVDDVEREFGRSWADAARGAPPENPQNRAAHTCNWLYKNMVMDANGRILPCCGAPRPNLHLVFANFPADADCFNSGDYQRARSTFAKGPDATLPGPVPHCENCEWDHTHTEVGRDQVALYLRTAGVPSAAVQTLADW
jgi:MoaA/NifB/PqqE/SkfB family radical SAM enzyme